MTTEHQSQQDAASTPAPSGVPKPEGSRNRRRIIIAGIVFAIIVVAIIILPWIFTALQWIYVIFFGPVGNFGLVRVVVASAQQPDNETIVVTYQGGQDAGIVERMTVTVSDSTGHEQTMMVGMEPQKRPFVLTDYLWFWDLIFPRYERGLQKFYPLPVGQNLTFHGSFAGKDHITAKVSLLDQTEMIIMDMNI